VLVGRDWHVDGDINKPYEIEAATFTEISGKRGRKDRKEREEEEGKGGG
jgi:hypothetical protein